MNKLKIAVQETFKDEVGEECVKNFVLEQDFGGCIEEMADIFRAILYWQSFVPETIDSAVLDPETIMQNRKERLDG